MCELTRERTQLVVERTAIKNKLHAERAQHQPNEDSIERMLTRIELTDEQIAAIEKSLKVLVASDEKIAADVKRTQTICGIAFLTAVTIHGETRGFELIENKKQLSSYAGFDVRYKQSGSSINGTTRISKRGNQYLRSAMYHPGMTLVNHNEYYRTLCHRIIARSGIKMKGYVAIQRHILELSFILHKNQEDFDKEYHTKKAAEVNLNRKLADNKIAALSV